MPAVTSIDEVISQLDQIVSWARGNNSRLGYFPALYRRVTINVKEHLAGGFFEDAPRMERLDVAFANRYLEAFDALRAGRRVARAWHTAFDAAGDRWAIVLQHLLLGMNAHINLDLAVAAAETCPGASIDGLQNDFDKVNALLASQINTVERELSAIWPLLHLLDWIAGRHDENVIRFSIALARTQAWNVATQLAHLTGPERENLIARVDENVATLGHHIQHPGPIVGTITNCIRLGEGVGVGRIIDILSRG